ncbi:integral membrane protein [Pectobacterium atrosepticum ICMP 1526]|uniref:DotA/TraY family protein n=1 Tax=Pectobacterium atrosepticum TaxID=29471 RepID=UPI000508741B|nr:membrane protein [Pectobacterium atrosepticum]KMK87535.1 integral membrane protein [Pectobacterium atrosepticum ICMP 1526]
MKNRFLVLCAGLLMPAIPVRAAVTYDDILAAATNAQDLSRQALITIFGDVVTNPLAGGNTTMVGNLFALFNGIIAILAVVWFIVIGLRHISKTGHQGKVFNGDRDIVGTLSTLLGFLMIIPSSNGWSLAQLAMLWGASIMGVGSANLMVQKAANDIASGYSLTVQPIQPSTRTAARGIFEMQLCKYAINSVIDDYNATAASSTPKMLESSGTSGGNYTVRVNNGSGVCGTSSIPEQQTSSSSSSWGNFLNPFNSNDTREIVDAQHAAMAAMITDMDSVASEFVRGFRAKRENGTGALPDIESRIQHAANTYEQTVQRALPAQNEQNAIQDAVRNYLDTYGWAALGAWYQTFATANQRLTEVASRAPSTSGMSSLGEIGDTDLFTAVMTAYRTQLQNSTYTPALGTVVSNNEQLAGQSNDPNSILMNTIAGPMQSFTTWIATSFSGSGTGNTQVNPLIKMKNVGDYTLVAAEGSLAAYTIARALVAGGEASIIGKIIDLTGSISAVDKGLEALSPAVYFLLLLMFTTGFTLSIYLPFIPFIYWMTGIGNWIVSVMVGCAAGPLWGATHLGTSQDRGSRAAYGYIYLIDTMIRPPLMVFGFFFASVAIVAAGTILHALFGAALVNVQANSLTGVFSLIGFLMLYARISTALVSSMFALQAYLPDYVISFLGGRDAANTLGSMANAVKDIFIAGNTNMRRTPGVNTNTMNNAPPNKDGING